MLPPRPVLLEGDLVRLEPFDRDRHAEALRAAARPEVFEFTGTSPYLRGWDGYFDDAADGSGGDVAFAQVERSSGEPVGMTRIIRVVTASSKLEIGYTWLTPRLWRTGFNREAKWLLLRHAFEDLGAVRVVLVTDIRNVRSQTAILGLGATKEGVLRKERQRMDGTWRDTVQFSIVDDDWPAVSARLRAG